MIIFNQKIHFNSVIFLTKHITCIFKINARVLTDVNSERPRAADVHLSLHSDLIIIIPLLQWLQASPPRPWWSSSSSPSWALSSWSYPGSCFGFSAGGEILTKSSAKGEWIIFVAQIKSVKHSMTHQFHSLIDTLLNVYRSFYLVNIIYLCILHRKLREKLDKFKQRKLESQREMSVSTLDSGNKAAGEAGDFQERYIM